MRFQRLLPIAFAALAIASGASAQLIPGRLVSGVWDGTTHTNGRQPMPAYGSGDWGFTYLSVEVPGTEPLELVGFRGVGGLDIDGADPTDTFEISVFSSLAAAIAEPRIGDLYHEMSPWTAAPEAWGSLIGLPGPIPAFKIESLPSEGTGLVVNGGDTIFVSVFSNNPSDWTWAETDIAYSLGPDPVQFDFNAGSIEYMTDPPWNYPNGVAAVDSYFTPVPEPSSLIVTGLGLAALAARRKAKLDEKN